MLNRPILAALLFLFLTAPVAGVAAQSTGGEMSWPGWEMSPAGEVESILPLRERARVYNELLEWGGVEFSTELEEQAIVTETGARFLNGYPRSLYLIR